MSRVGRPGRVGRISTLLDRSSDHISVLLPCPVPFLRVGPESNVHLDTTSVFPSLEEMGRGPDQEHVTTSSRQQLFRFCGRDQEARRPCLSVSRLLLVCVG